MAKHKKRALTSSNSDSDEKKQHKLKSGKHKDKHKKDKHKEKGKDKKKESAASAEEKLRVKEAKAFLKRRLKEQGDSKARERLDNSLPPPGFKADVISNEDYFAKNPEFSAWLSDTQGIQFNDLEAADAHARFGTFVAAWNEAAVPLRLYSGIDGGSLKRTQHSWGMRGAGGGAIVRGMAAVMEEEREAAAAASSGRQVERRKWKEEQAELLDQMLPPATAGTGEARVEARVARREDRCAREGSPDTAHLPGGGDASGFGGDNTFAAAKQREASAAHKRQRFGSYKSAEAAQKIAEHGQKEDATMAQFRALLDKGPIAIPKR